MISSRNLYNVKFNGIELESKLLKSTSDREIASSINFINLGIDLQIFSSTLWSVHYGRFNGWGFHGLPTPGDQGLCHIVYVDSIKNGPKYFKSNVKSLASPCVTELDQRKVGC